MLPGRKRDEGETGTTTAVARLGDRARKGAVLLFKLHRFVAARVSFVIRTRVLVSRQ